MAMISTMFICHLFLKNNCWAGNCFVWQNADRKVEGQIDFEGLQRIYDDIMNLKEVRTFALAALLTDSLMLLTRGSVYKYHA